MGFLPWHHRRHVAPVPVAEKPGERDKPDPNIFGSGRTPNAAKPVSPRQAVDVDTQPENVTALDAELHRIEVDAWALRGFVAPAQLNPCVVVYRGCLWCNVRVVSMGKTHNFLGRIDDVWSLRWPRELENRTTLHRPNGFEDLRLFFMGEKLMGCATVFDALAEMVVLEIMAEATAADIVEAHLQPSAAGVHEKNWMPLVAPYPGGRELQFVYSADPTVVVSFDAATKKVKDLPAAPMSVKLRGGSQVVPFPYGYLAVVHEVHRSTTAGVLYLHRLVRFDACMKLIKVSEPFRFAREGIEFCAGLAHYKNKWVMSFGASDNEAWLAVVDEAVVERMVQA